MLKLEFENGDITLRIYNDQNGYIYGRHLLQVVDCRIRNEWVVFYSEDGRAFVCMKSDIKIIGDLFSIPHGALGEGWAE